MVCNAQLLDVVAADPQAPDTSVEHYGCVVLERGEYSLTEFLKRNKRLHAIKLNGILHEFLQAVHALHSEKGAQVSRIPCHFARLFEPTSYRTSVK